MSPRRAPRAAGAVVEARLRAVLAAEDVHADPDLPATEVRRRVVDLLAELGADGVWLAYATVRAEIPGCARVRALQRRAELDGAAAALGEIEDGLTPAAARRVVRVARGRTLVDVHQLATSPFTTGIQRVAGAVAKRWDATQDVDLVAWTGDFTAPVTLDADQTARALGTPEPDRTPIVVVPWRGRYVVPEVALDPGRTERMRSIALHARCRTSAIAYDLVPVAAAETTETGVPSDFSHQLAALRHFDALAAISDATRQEYEGWRTMLGAVGLPGPAVTAVSLPAEASGCSPEALAGARARYTVPGVPLVLCVGSHEPRKNHLGVLHAAELLWRDGLQFSLLFVGGNSWGAGPFRRWASELTAAGRPVETVDAVDDDTLWALYRLARCTVFPSFAEGFGLPLAESLACGTPAVTSALGAMAEIAADGGAITVDPRDRHAIAGAVRSLLTDDHRHAQLAADARRRPARSWDDYAAAVWDALDARAEEGRG